MKKMDPLIRLVKDHENISEFLEDVGETEGFLHNEEAWRKIKPVEDREDMVILVPESPFEPGGYAFSFSDSYCVFSVNFDSYDKDSEALDRITPPGWAGWSRDIYEPHGKHGVSSPIRSSSPRSPRGPSRVSLYAAQRLGMKYIEEADYPLSEEQLIKALGMQNKGSKTDNAKSYFGLISITAIAV